MSSNTETKEKIVIAVLQGLYSNPEFLKYLGRMEDEQQAYHSAMKAVMVAEATMKEMNKTSNT